LSPNGGTESDSGPRGAVPGGWIGTDEAGKGDYFGPLVVAAVYVNDATASELSDAGVRDSKRVSDRRSAELAARIRSLCPTRVVAIGPERYNALYAEMRNLNRLLAWAHARAIENLLADVDCQRVISDQFADERVLQRALMAKGRAIHLVQRPRAEEDVAVAAASLVARAEFLARLRQLSTDVGVELAKGAGDPVLHAGALLIRRHGTDVLAKVAKLHFRTTQVLTAAERQ
jgi:ribonuclease HIII